MLGSLRSAGLGFAISWAFFAATAVLILGALAIQSGLGGGRTRRSSVLVKAALIVQFAGLFVQGIAAQRAWGAYWSWDPVECWRLLAGLLIVLGLTSAGEQNTSPWRTRAVLIVAFLAAMAGVVGIGPLMRVLSLTSRYATL